MISWSLAQWLRDILSVHITPAVRATALAQSIGPARSCICDREEGWGGMSELGKCIARMLPRCVLNNNNNHGHVAFWPQDLSSRSGLVYSMQRHNFVPALCTIKYICN